MLNLNEFRHLSSSVEDPEVLRMLWTEKIKDFLLLSYKINFLVKKMTQNAWVSFSGPRATHMCALPLKQARWTCSGTWPLSVKKSQLCKLKMPAICPSPFPPPWLAHRGHAAFLTRGGALCQKISTANARAGLGTYCLIPSFPGPPTFSVNECGMNGMRNFIQN